MQLQLIINESEELHFSDVKYGQRFLDILFCSITIIDIRLWHGF